MTAAAQASPLRLRARRCGLAQTLTSKAKTIAPAGGQNGKTFEGIFDGGGKRIDNFVLDTGNTVNIGLIGKAGQNSVIKNLTVGSAASLSLSLSASDNDKAIENVGMLVGYSAGSVENCTNNGKVTVSHAMDQTKSIVFPIKNVGGLAGVCEGNVSSCTNNGFVSVSETGVPYKAGKDEADWDDQSILAIKTSGGIVGSAGALDSSLDKATSGAHGFVSGCANTGNVSVDTPRRPTASADRFGNVVYSQGSNVGGIAGYSRASIDSCYNSGYLSANHTTGVAGIVGSLRAETTTSSYHGNFSQEGSDDGMTEGAASLSITNCGNSGNVWGYAFPAGIAGRTGTNTSIEGCLNDSGTYVLGTRSTKPFPSGIVGSSYGTVAYCANLGTVAAGTWEDESLKTIKTSGGYFASGIAGNISYFTKAEDGAQTRVSPLPEVYGCYNAGTVLAIDNMRQRALVGDNSGYVHDNVAEKGKVYDDRLVYGMYSDDTESSGGTVSNNVLVSNGELKNNTSIETSQGSSSTAVAEGATVLSILNSAGDKGGWSRYWAKSDGTVNGGYPVLNRQVTWSSDRYCQRNRRACNQRPVYGS